MIKNIFRSRLMVFGSLMIVFGCFSLLQEVPVFAAQCGGANTAIIECGENEGGIWHILNLVIQIFSIGVGILGVVGIMVLGTQVLSAKGSSDEVNKAKTRLLQIVVGLVLYAALFSLSQWLLPGGMMNSSLQSVGTTTQVKEMEAKLEEAKRKAAEARAKRESGDDSGSGGDSGSGDDSGSGASGSTTGKTNSEIVAELAKVAKNFADKNNRKEYQAAVKSTGAGGKSDTCKKLGKACGVFVSTVVRSVLGINNFPMTSDSIYRYAKNHSKKWKIIKASNGKPEPGDIVYETGGGVWTSHSGMVVNNNGKTVIAEASYPKGGASNSTCSNGSSPHVTSYTKAGGRYGRPDGYYIRYIGDGK